MNNGIDCKLIQTNNFNYVFFRDFLSIYKIEDEIINDYFKGKIPIDNPIYAKIENEFDKANKQLLEISQANSKNVYFDTIVLIITRDCNLRCKYCYSVSSIENSKEKMGIDVARDAINFLLNKSPERNEYGIVFFGGEPFMNFELMQDIIHFAKAEIIDKRGKKINFGLTTNGTILNENILSLILNESIALQISMDGTKVNHDRNRVFVNGSGSFDKIMKNAMTLKDAGVLFNFRPTFSVDTEIFKNIKTMEDLKIPFGFGFTLNTIDKSKEITDFEYSNWNEIRESFNMIVDFFYCKIVNKETVYCMNIINSLYILDGKLGKNINCTSGLSTLSVLPDGSLLSCQNFQNHPECIIGEINSEFVESTISAISVNEISECNNCWTKFLCGGSCYFAKYEENGNMVDPVLSSCELTRLYWESILKLYSNLQEINPVNTYLANYNSTFKINV
jgi:radical SAM additional 4Fe4S-binding domain